MSEQYQVLNPQGETDPIPQKGIAPRLDDLNGKTIGFFANIVKPASQPILVEVEDRLKKKFPSIKSSWFLYARSGGVGESVDKAKFKK